MTRVPLGLALNLWERMSTWEATVEIARLADELGYATLVIPESFGRDAFVLCDRLLAATNQINVCLGLANVYSRSPAVLASAAATLDEASGGRFILGLGSSTPNLVEGWHGLPFGRPLTRMRETIEMCHRIWARDKTPYDGTIFKAGGVKLTFTPVRERIPIWLGSLLPRSTELCGELGDGWMATLFPADGLASGREALARGAAKAGREPADVTVAPTMNLMVTEEPAAALGVMKFGVAIYYGPPNSPYTKAAAAIGYADDVAAVTDAYTQGGSGAAAAAVSDRLARSMSIVGTIDECRAQIAAMLAGAADQVVLGMPAATRAACEPILAGLLPD